MSIKPVLVPDQDAKTLRALLENFDAAAAGTAKKQLNEMDYGGGRSPHGGHGLPRDDDDDDAGKKEIMVKPETAKKATKNASDALNKAFDASYDKKGVAEGSLTEFAPSQPGGDDDGDDDGFDEETLRRIAAHWLEGDEDPRIEQLLAAAGWEIGQDEGYDDEPGVFVVMSGDEHGKSYISWPAAELRSAMSEGTMSRAAKGYEKYGKEGMAALAKAGREGRDLDPVRAKYDRYDEGAESENLAIGEKMARDGIEYDPAREGEIISMIGDYLRRDGMTTRQVRGYMIDPDFISDQLSYLPRKSGVAEADVPYNDPNLSKAYNLGNEAYTKLKNHPELAQAAQDRIEKEFPQYAQMWTRGYQDGERFDQEKSLKESRDPLVDLRRLLG